METDALYLTFSFFYTTIYIRWALLKLQAMVISLTCDGWWGLKCNGAQVIDDAKNQDLMSVKM